MTSTTSAPTDRDDQAARTAAQRMGAGLVFMGVLHVVAPKPFLKIIPKQLGAPRFWNLAAAAAETSAGVLLLQADPAKRRAGAWLALLTFVGVYPANINMALEMGKPTNPKAIGAWLRLPMQFPMIRQAYQLTK